MAWSNNTEEQNDKTTKLSFQRTRAKFFVIYNRHSRKFSDCIKTGWALQHHHIQKRKRTCESCRAAPMRQHIDTPLLFFIELILCNVGELYSEETCRYRLRSRLFPCVCMYGCRGDWHVVPVRGVFSEQSGRRRQADFHCMPTVLPPLSTMGNSMVVAAAVSM